RRDGRSVEAGAQVTKTGYCYLFDRVTGKPLFPVAEVPVPSSDVPGEEAYPTQPRPMKPPPFSRQRFTDDDVTKRTPEAHEEVLSRLRAYRRGQPFTPPGEAGSVSMPGFHGGATWSGASFDPTARLLYVNSNNIPWLSTLRKAKDGGFDFAGYSYFTDKDGYPAIKPPWGNL